MDRCDTCRDVISFCKCYEDVLGNCKKNMLDVAIEEALHYHEGQKDKSGNPYIGHLFRVMNSLESEEEKIVGVLHDIVEDTEVTLEDLKYKGFSSRIIDAIDSVTRREDEDYNDFIIRISKNPLAVKVKLADLEDNMDISRLPMVEQEDLDRLKKYKNAKKYLSKI